MRPVVWFTVIFLSLAAAGLAQTPSDPLEIDFETARFSRIAHALAIEEAIVIDGRLDESAWGDAVPVTGFLQSGRSRNPGGPATEM